MQGLIAEYLGVTLFLYVAISTIASGCHLPDVAANSKNSQNLQNGKLPHMPVFMRSTMGPHGRLAE